MSVIQGFAHISGLGVVTYWNEQTAGNGNLFIKFGIRCVRKETIRSGQRQGELIDRVCFVQAALFGDNAKRYGGRDPQEMKGKVVAFSGDLGTSNQPDPITGEDVTIMELGGFPNIEIVEGASQIGAGLSERPAQGRGAVEDFDRMPPPAGGRPLGAGEERL